MPPEEKINAVTSAVPASGGERREPGVNSFHVRNKGRFHRLAATRRRGPNEAINRPAVEGLKPSMPSR